MIDAAQALRRLTETLPTARSSVMSIGKVMLVGAERFCRTRSNNVQKHETSPLSVQSFAVVWPMPEDAPLRSFGVRPAGRLSLCHDKFPLLVGPPAYPRGRSSARREQAELS